YRGRVPVELMGRTPFPPVGELPYLLTIAAHGFYWFRLATDVPVPTWHEPQVAAEDRPVVVLFDGWNSFFRDRVVPWRIGMAVKTRAQFEGETLPGYIADQRWFGFKSETIARARLVENTVWEVRDGGAPESWLLQIVELDGLSEPASYFVPLALGWEDRDEERMRALAPAAVARVRQQAEIGVMADAFADESFCRALVAAIGAGLQLPGAAGAGTAAGSFRFKPTKAFAKIAGRDVAALPVGRPQAQSSNTIVTLGDRLFLKGYRRLRRGINPEFELGSYLTDVAHFAHTAPVAGVLEHVAADGVSTQLALVQAHVSNQGDGWTNTLSYLGRYFELLRGATESLPPDAHAPYLALARTLGTRTGELHSALSRPSKDPNFGADPLGAADVAAYRSNALAELRNSLAALEAALGTLNPPVLDDARALLAARAALEQRIAQMAAEAAEARDARKIRIHGDFHLGQVLIARNDFVIVDFEGEPGRSLEERRAKQSPLRDVAGLLRSLSYARESGLRQAATNAEEAARFAPLADAWERESRNAFLQGYEEAAASGPLDPARGLLGLFLLEKALYELRYELGNRPDWVGIPLRGLLTLAGLPHSHTPGVAER
ncbi:MAG TPA: putative maltokinase, partial [Rhizobacter sp.]|nr:putative maltokinase [Rhizobacter sp.]